MQPKSVKRDKNYIHIVWEDDHASVYELNYLRRRCPCVMCKNTKDRTPDGGIELPSAVVGPPLDILKIEPVGRYALQINFSDGHSTGIYSYDHLRKICACEKCSAKKQEIILSDPYHASR